MINSTTNSLIVQGSEVSLKRLVSSLLQSHFDDTIADSIKIPMLKEEDVRVNILGKSLEEVLQAQVSIINKSESVAQSENFDDAVLTEIAKKNEDQPFESPNIILGLGQLYNQAIELLNILRSNDPMYILKTIIIDEINGEKDFQLEKSPKKDVWVKMLKIFEEQHFLLDKKAKASKGGRIAPYETLSETLNMFTNIKAFRECINELSPNGCKKLESALSNQTKNGIHRDNLGHYQQLTKILNSISQQLRIKYQLWKPLISLDTASVGVYSTKIRGYDPNNNRYYSKKFLHTKDVNAINYIGISELLSIFTIQLQDDEDFIKVYSIDFQAGSNYSIVTEFGLGSLSEFHKFRLRENLPWNSIEIQDFTKCINKQLQKLKDIDVVHRDINPDNIIITENLKFKIKDFSTSEIHIDHDTQYIVVGGTPGYWHEEIEKSIEKCHNIVKLNPYDADKYSVDRIIRLLEQFVAKDSKDKESTVRDGKAFKRHMIGRIYKHVGVEIQPKLAVVFTHLYSLNETAEWLALQLTTKDVVLGIIVKEWYLYLLGCIYFLRKEYAKARKFFQFQLEIRMDVANKNNEAIAELHEKVAMCSFFTDQVPLAIKNLESSLKLKEKIFGKGSLEVAKSKLLLGIIELEQEDNSNSKPYFDAAYEIASKKLSKDDPLMSEYFLYQGIGFLEANKNEEALVCFKKGIQLQLEKDSKINIDLAIGTFTLTFHLLDPDDKKDEAIKSVHTLLNAIILKLGEHHPDSIFCMAYLAVTLHSHDIFKDAMKYYNKAEELARKNLGERNPILAKIYHNLGLVYAGTGKHEVAIGNFKQSLSILLQNREFFQGYDLLFSYKGIGELILIFDVNSYLSRVSAYISEDNIKLDVISNYYNIGLSCIEQKKYKSALKYLANCLELEKKLHGEVHIEQVSTYTHIALALDGEANFDEAIKSYKQAIAIAIENGGEIQETVASMYQAIGVLYDKLNRSKKAVEWFNKALNVRKGLDVDQSQDISKLEHLIKLLS